MHPQNLSPSARTKRHRSHIAAACLATLVSGVAGTAADAKDCDCHSGHGPIYCTLDALAGGIEKLLGLDQRHRHGCDELACDDGCDALVTGHGMPMEMHRHGHGGPMMYGPMQGPMHAPMHGPHAPIHDQPIDPYESQPLEQSAPYISEPVEHQPMMQPDGGPMRMSPHRLTPMSESQPQRTPIRQMPSHPTGSGVMPSESDAGGSLFDTLEDPFRDDSAKARRSNSIPSRPASYRTSLRRAHSSR